jgi:acyl-CoA oxidase
VDSSAIAALIWGRETLATRARIEEIVAADPVFDITDVPSMSRVEKLELSLKRGKVSKRLRAKHNWNDAEYAYANVAAGEMHAYALHDKAFLKVLTDQGTEEQHQAFLVPAKADKVIGCYAQTELSHGSNIRGLETTATWNPADKTFTIHSPSITACKWWIGTLGRTANHALVMAQLIVGGKNLGPHTFIVPIRDMQTHEPLDNVFIGDIGPKVGYK